MYLYDDPTVVAVRPDPPVAATPGYFFDGNPGAGQAASIVRAHFLNMVMGELLSFLSAAQLAGDRTQFDQVLTSINRLLGGNLGSITSSGALTLDNLGLLLVDATAGNITLTLPAVNALGGHRMRYRFVRLDNTANVVLLTPHAGDTINGAGVGFVLTQLDLDGDGSHTWKPKSERIRLLNNLTLHVATTGSDSTGTGLSVATALRTIQAAVDWARQNVDSRGNTVVVSIEPGGGTSYAGVSCNSAIPGGGTLQIIGNGANASDVVIDAGAGTCVLAQNFSLVDLHHLKVQANSVGGEGLVCSGSTLSFQDLVFGAVNDAQIFADGGGYVAIRGSYSVVAGGAAHIRSHRGGSVNYDAATIVTLTGTPAFSAAFAEASQAQINAGVATFSGPATGKRYNSATGASITTLGGGANFFPGSIAGTADAATYASYS
jgi:hypothetical protein